MLGADGLIYQGVEDLVACGRDLNPDIHDFDDSCFTGGCFWVHLQLLRGRAWPAGGAEHCGWTAAAVRGCTAGQLGAVPDLARSMVTLCGQRQLPHLRTSPPLPCAGRYVTGDINEAYLRNLEEQGRGKRRARPGRKASLVAPAAAPAASSADAADRLPAPTA